MTWDVLVAGGGAAGLMCAIEAAKRSRRVAVLEHNSEIGRKILISGGGRCNFTNIHTRPEHFLSSNPHFAKSALARYTAADFVAMVRRHSIPFHEKKLGQLFCDRSARDITAMLLAECDRAGVQIFTGCSAGEVRKTTGFVLQTNQGVFEAPALVIATGGLSIPKIGASDWGYRVARQFGVRLVPSYPALVPLTFHTSDARIYGTLAGVATEVIASNRRASFQEKMLFTHRGLSGPAILQISSYWKAGESIQIDLFPGIDINGELLARKRSTPKHLLPSILAERLPRRLAEVVASVEDRPVGSIPDRDLIRFSSSLHEWRINPNGTEGYQKAEVTAGGVNTDEISSRTMEARNVPGLYFVGEILDVTGHLGGFNFQWAWASGFAAGQAV